jgi:excisionase family DNA binding protein
MEAIFLNTQEAASMLKVSTSTVYKMVMRKTIPFHKLGRKTLYDSNELIEFVKGTQPDINPNLPRPKIKI